MGFADIIQLQAKCGIRLISTEEICTEARILYSVYIASSDFSSFVSVIVNVTLIQDRYVWTYET